MGLYSGRIIIAGLFANGNLGLMFGRAFIIYRNFTVLENKPSHMKTSTARINEWRHFGGNHFRHGWILYTSEKTTLALPLVCHFREKPLPLFNFSIGLSASPQKKSHFRFWGLLIPLSRLRFGNLFVWFVTVLHANTSFSRLPTYLFIYFTLISLSFLSCVLQPR